MKSKTTAAAPYAEPHTIHLVGRRARGVVARCNPGTHDAILKYKIGLTSF